MSARWRTGWRLLASLTAPYLLRRAGHTDYLRYLADDDATQWRPAPEIQALQWERFQRLLSHAARNVPFHRDRFARLGIRPESIARREDLSRIPTISKTDLRQHRDEMVADGVDAATLLTRTSSGSTGKPTLIYIDGDRANRSWAWNTRHNRWAGLDWGCRLASMGLGTRRDASGPAPTGVRGILRSWSARAMGYAREETLDPYNHTEADLRRFAERLVRFRPHVLMGYSNTMHSFARAVQAAGIRGIRPHGIICGGETLDADARQVIESAFDSRVFLRYGTREVDIIASECEQGTLHVADDNLLVEVLAEPGERVGRVVVTDLWNYAMPIVWYDLEDVVSLADEPCSCGRGLSVLAGVEGRRTELFRTVDGRLVSGLWFTVLMRNKPGLSRYQIRQTAPQAFHIRVVTDGIVRTEDMLGSVVTEIQARFGRETTVVITRESEIPQVGDGKFRYLVSDVA
jgi:phenylacetate-CoA ligase